MSNKPDLGDYVDVATRIAEFREKYPNGSLRPLDPDKPYTVETIGEHVFIVVVAAAYRQSNDTAPGVGMAMEPFPGRTPYTRGSELQNCETSAWGRAIVAVGAADTKRGVASAEEVRAQRHHNSERQAAEPAMKRMFGCFKAANITDRDGQLNFIEEAIGRRVSSRSELTAREVAEVTRLLVEGTNEDKTSTPDRTDR